MNNHKNLSTQEKLLEEEQQRRSDRARIMETLDTQGTDLLLLFFKNHHFSFSC